jgi:ABC-type multidrug transport system fused ATPase/permease subunit
MKALFNLIKDKKLPLMVCTLLAALGSLFLIVPFALIFKIIDYYLQFGVKAPVEPVLNWLGLAIGALILRYGLIVASFRACPVRVRRL